MEKHYVWNQRQGSRYYGGEQRNWRGDGAAARRPRREGGAWRAPDRSPRISGRANRSGGRPCILHSHRRTRQGYVVNLVKAACARFGKLDVFISNAGIGPISLFDDLRVEDWDAM